MAISTSRYTGMLRHRPTHDERGDHGGRLCVPRTISPSLTGAFAASRPQHHRRRRGQHDRSLDMAFRLAYPSARMLPRSSVVKALVGADDAVLGTHRLVRRSTAILLRQHKDLYVLSGVGAGEQHQPAQQANKHHGHERADQRPRHGPRHPQASPSSARTQVPK